MNKIDKILIILAVFMVLFIAAVLVIFWHTGAEPTVLVGGVATAVVTEILALCRIKTGRKEKDDEQSGGTDC